VSGLRWRELTAPGRGAIRVLELTGPGAVERLHALAPRRAVAPGEFACVALRDERGELLDEALVLVHSRERVELHLHGAPALVERLRLELGAEPGEAAPRSIEERAEAHLAAAACEAAARVFLDQAEGALRRELEALLSRSGADLRAAARELARRGEVARRLVRPPRVVLAGAVNAGKSTLFNLLVGRERVVVDAAAGTTRDVVHERVQLGAYAVELFDTAGERELDGEREDVQVERAGQALAAELRRSADLVLWLVPPWQARPQQAAARQCYVQSRADLAPPRASAPPWPALSALCAPEHTRLQVAELLRTALDLPLEPHVPGAGVPFEVEWIETLARAEPEALATAVRAWLDHGEHSGFDRIPSFA
jgi:tRNA modification GTPase